MTSVKARSRLHFGLLHPPRGQETHWSGLDGEIGIPIRYFGGVGLMIDEPGISGHLRRSSAWSAEGSCANRAKIFAEKFVATLPPELQQPFEIRIDCCPPEHVGLGTGTALGLAVAKAIADELGLSFPAVELARRIGRGERSAIGVHGFELGGLIVEGGKRPEEAISPLLAQFPFPEVWRVTLYQPEASGNWFGDREREAFLGLRQLSTQSEAELDRLCRLIVMGILPGIANRDLATFGEAVFEYNARAGDLFASVQGGRYASPAIAAKIAELRKSGVRCVGQSSWGPTVFAIESR